MRLTLPVTRVASSTPRASLVTIDLDGHPFPFEAGQAVFVGLPDTTIRRPFSLASSPGRVAETGQLELLVGHDVQGRVGGELALAAGRHVDVEGPLGRFVFPAVPVERRVLFVAGGTGIAPLRAMWQQALTRPDTWVGVVYSVRTPDEFACGEELRALAASGRIVLRETVTRDAGVAWAGHRGRVDDTVLGPLVEDPATLCFVCGPPALVHDVPRQLVALGVARERVRIEQW